MCPCLPERIVQFTENQSVQSFYFQKQVPCSDKFELRRTSPRSSYRYLGSFVVKGQLDYEESSIIQVQLLAKVFSLICFSSSDMLVFHLKQAKLLLSLVLFMACM